MRLQRFAIGDTNYVAKHNANADTLEQTVNAMQQAMGANLGSVISVGQAFEAIFGTQAAVIGATSYACTGSGSTLTVQPGFSWEPTSGNIYRLAASTTVSFSGVSAGTYYVSPDPGGNPARTTSAAGALYQVVWTGSAFGAITRVAPVTWGASDWQAAQSSAALAQSFTSLDARLEASESGAAAGGLARTAQAGRLSLALNNVNITLTAAQANNAVLDFSGTLTANVTITLPTTGPRTWLAVNRCTGNFRLTLRTATGAGVILPTASSVMVYHNGSELQVAAMQPGRPSILALPTGSTLTADFARADLVRCTLTGNNAVALTGAHDGQRCMLEVIQDAAGGWVPTFGPEMNMGADIDTLDLSTAGGSRNRLGFIFNASSGQYDLVAVMRGY
jgi:hypothetical protein